MVHGQGHHIVHRRIRKARMPAICHEYRIFMTRHAAVISYNAFVSSSAMSLISKF